MSQIIDYLAVFALGGLVGYVEILSRYKDAPFRVAFSRPGLMYTGINALVASLALMTVRLFGWTFTDNPASSAEVIRWMQVLISGLAAMTLFRSSLFNFHMAEQDISIGPNAILQILLVAVDKEVDRLRGKERARIVEEAMDGISFNDAVLNLPTVCIALMQNLSREDQDEILQSVKALNSEEAKNMPERMKTMSLGLTIMNVVGEAILKAAIDMVNLDENRKMASGKSAGAVIGQVGQLVSGKPVESEISSDVLKEKLKEKLKTTEESTASPSVEVQAQPALATIENVDPLKEKLKEKLQSSSENQPGS